MKVFVPMEKNGPHVYADARADAYEQSETHHMYSCSSGRVVPIYIRLFPRSAYIAVIYRAEGRGRRLCIVQGRAQAFGLGELVGVITGGDQFTLEEILELFWCCSALMIILTGCYPMYVISAMLGVKKNEEIAAEQEWVNSKPDTAELTAAGNAGILTPQSGGTGIITLSHPEAVDTVSIPYTVEAGNHPMIDPADESKYLTASQSSYTADVGRIITMRASLINGKPIEALDIRWSTGDTGIVKILGAGGPEVGVQTLAAGTAAVIAQHAQSKNTLTFTVLVAGAGQIHLLPGKTAYLGSVGETMSVSATLYGVRSPVELLGITWSSADAAIAQLVGSTGSSIQVIAKKVGTTTITPTHPKARNSPPITIHVSAAKKRRQDVKYLAARTNAMELQIDAAENLRVRLIGGNALDEQGITWGVDDSTRLQMIGTSGSTVIVKGLMAGTVTVTASHPQSVNSLSITINVRDAVRRLSLSSSTMRFKSNDSAKSLTLLIRGGFNTDYDNLAWSSSDTNVATVFGTSRTVNINPVGEGNATITAELTLTGQKVTALIEVLPARYIRLPRNMRVEEGKSETFTFEFATGGNPISFYPSDKAVTVVQGSGADKNKITVFGAAQREGNFSIRAVAPGNVQDSAGVEVWVKRSLVITHANRAKINIEPGADPVVRNLAIIPQWEATSALKGDLTAGKIEAYMASGGATIAKVTINPQSRTFAVTATKEGTEAVMIRDNRTDPPTEYRIPIESEYEDLSKILRLTPRQKNPMWVVHNADNGSGSSGHLDAHTTNGRVTLDIPASVNVKSFRFTGESASGSSAALKIQIKAYNNDQRTVDFYMEARKFFKYPLHNMGRVHMFRYLHFVIMHGARGDKEYKGSIAFESKGWQ